MKILISTTNNWNPGDEFIRYGVKNILNKVFLNPTYIHYDRNPDYFTQSWKMDTNFKSNVMNNPIDWSMIDLVVLAGSPEFLHGPLNPIYEGLLNHPNIPLFCVGVGYSFKFDGNCLTPTEKTVLKRDNTLIITRQFDLQKELQSCLNKNIECLPCPALFSTHDIRQFHVYDTLLIPQSNTGYQPISLEDFNNTKKYYNNNKIVHYIEDLKQFPDAYYNPETPQLLNEICKYETVISNRLHGGIPALGNFAKVKFINSDYRVQIALEPYKQYLKDDGFYSITNKEYFDLFVEYINTINNFLDK